MKRSQAGFTLMEIMVATAIFAILSAIAIPNYIGWLPGHRLRSAAADIRSNMQLAKMQAIKDNRYYAVVFNSGAGTYQIVDCGVDGTYNTADDQVLKTVNLTEYGSGVTYGYGNATTNATTSGGSLPADFVSYSVPADNVAMFAPTGLAQTATGAFSSGYVYIANNRNQTCAVGTNTVAGNIVVRYWSSGAWN